MSRLYTGELLKSFSLEEYGPVRTFRLSADAHLLITGHDDGSVVVRTARAERRGVIWVLGTHGDGGLMYVCANCVEGFI